MHLRPRRRLYRLAGLAALIAVGASAGSALSASTPVPVSAGGLRPLTNVNPLADPLGFFPRIVTIHAGDSVRWSINGFHTVTFPGPTKPYPFIVPGAGLQPVTNDAAGNPLWWGGKAPIMTVSPLAILQQGGGTMSSPPQVRSSGLLRVFTASPNTPPAPYTIRFTKPGVYRYLCAVHQGMRGAVVVVPKHAPVPSRARLIRLGQAQFARVVRQTRRLGKIKPAKPGRVFVGIGTPQGTNITAMFPPKLTVKAGTTVRFANMSVSDPHTVTFGPAAFRAQIEKTFVTPGNPTTFNPFGFFSSEPPGSPAPVAYDGTNHGDGYLNSGILLPKGSGAASRFSVTFSKPGTYNYECVIHPNMDGRIVVT